MSKGKLSIGIVEGAKEHIGDGWDTQDFDVVVRRNGYVIATIGQLYKNKRPREHVTWMALNDGSLGVYQTRSEAIRAVKDNARTNLARAIEEGVL